MAIIAADGEAAVRVKDIVEAAGVQVPVLYRHFGSREGLVQAAQVERLVRDIDAQLEEITQVIEGINTIEDFRLVIDMILASLAAPARKKVRFQRLSVLGSAYGRPALVAEVARLQALYLEATANLLRRPEERGWLVEGLNVEAFASWFAGQMLGRVMIEFGEPIVEEAEYDAIVNQAVKHILFG